MYVVVYEVGHDWSDDGNVVWIPRELTMKVWARDVKAAKERFLDRFFSNTWEDDKATARVVAIVQYS